MAGTQLSSPLTSDAVMHSLFFLTGSVEPIRVLRIIVQFHQWILLLESANETGIAGSANIRLNGEIVKINVC